jgi:Ca2+-transporting ATPase
LDSVSKAPYNSENDSLCDPFIRADALCTSGSAKLLVCCVGEKSTRGILSKKLEDDSINTKLQTKLKNLSS